MLVHLETKLLHRKGSKTLFYGKACSGIKKEDYLKAMQAKQTIASESSWNKESSVSEWKNESDDSSKTDDYKTGAEQLI